MSYIPPPQAPPPQVIALRPSKALAATALVLGLCSLIPFLGIICAVLAIIFAFMALSRKAPGRNMAVIGLVVAFVGIVESAGLMFLTVRAISTTLVGARDRARQAVCRSNLHQLGMTIEMYKAEYGAPAPSVAVLFRSQGMPNNILECPSANTPGRASVFVLLSVPSQAPPDAFVACDYRGNHPHGRNVLHMDGSVTFYDEPDFQAELAKPENAAFAAALRAKEGP